MFWYPLRKPSVPDKVSYKKRQWVLEKVPSIIKKLWVPEKSSWVSEPRVHVKDPEYVSVPRTSKMCLRTKPWVPVKLSKSS